MNYIKIIIVLLFFGCPVFAVNDPFYPFHPASSIQFESSNLPIVIIDLDVRMANKAEDRRIPATMKIIWNEKGGRNYISDTQSYNYDGKIGIKYRGNSSYANSDKKPFGIRIQDNEGKKQKASILGMGKDEDWALLAPFNDKSMIRDVLIYDLMRGTMEYVPTGKYCEVVLNGVYQGVYIMAARVRQGSNRINIDKPSAESGDGLTGGYHLEIDRSDEPGFRGQVPVKDLLENNFFTQIKTYYQFKYPDPEDLTEAQKNYIQNQVWSMENAIAGSDFKDPRTGYRAYLDTFSLMDYYITQELGKNTDGYRLSTPFYKYPDSKDKRFKFSIWDFNIAMGNANYMNGWSTEGWSFNNKSHSEELPVPWMFKRILQDEIFYSNLQNQWTEYRKDLLRDERIGQKIDSLVSLLQESQKRNFTIWNRFNTLVWPNYYNSSSWEDEINFVRRWIKKRTAWIDSQWSSETVNKVQNANFEASEPRNYNNETWVSEWDLSGSGAGLSTSNKYSGNYALSLQSGCTASQILTELTPGKYTLRARVNTQANAGATIRLRYHNNKNGSEPLVFNISDYQPFHLVEIKDIPVANSFAELSFIVSVREGDVRLRVDEVEFFKQQGSETHIEQPFYADNTIQIRTDRLINKLEITVSDNRAALPVEIFTTTGQLIYKGKISWGSLEVSHIFSPGCIYIVRVGTKTQKIIF